MPASPNQNSRHAVFRSAELKLGLTLTVILTASLIPADFWPAHGVLLGLTFAGLSLAGVRLRYLARRLALFLPVLVVFGLTVPITQLDREAAWIWAVGLCLRCIVSFLAGLWLIHVLPFPELLSTLSRWNCPGLIIGILMFMYRYIFVLWDELSRLRNAREARNFGGHSWFRDWSANAQMIGLLLLRAMERAERTHSAMLARGWDGTLKVHHESDGRGAR